MPSEWQTSSNQGVYSINVLLNIPVSSTNPKAGSSGEKEVAGSEGAAAIEEEVETEEPVKTEENSGGLWTSRRSRLKNRMS